MQWFKAIIYNASIFSLFSELCNKYPHPVIIYENSIVHRANTEIYYQILTELNSHWISKSLDNDHYVNAINSLHVFCVDKISQSIDHILDNILSSSNSFKIQNLIIFNDHESNSVTTDFFAAHERLHQNTLICERDEKNITCWRWVNRNGGENRTLNDLLNEPIDFHLSKIQISSYNVPPNAFTPCLSGRSIFSGLDAMVSAEIVSRVNATPKYCNKLLKRQRDRGFCNKMDKIDDNAAFKLLQQLKLNEKTEFEHIFYHTVFDSRMVKYLFFESAEWLVHLLLLSTKN